ncbi:CAP Gly-rich domain-containing protein [Absidia repens]|uniref:CAP Gly-rich domain-containing protein n=1 Tax=Absidia repens TaxID=90262 RepID=A0A1X2I5J1_9FUNG|nr:CAP Gly-rich domain-containing protein [Absidia repens]
MHLFGFSKKAKKRLSSGHLNLGLRKCKSTGNIHSSDTDRDDSSIGSSGGSSNYDNDDSETRLSKQHARMKSLDTGMDEKNRQDQQPAFPEPAPPATEEETNPPILTISHPPSPTQNDNDELIKDSQPQEMETLPIPQPQTVHQEKPHNYDEQQQKDDDDNNNGIDPNDLNTLLLMESQQRLEQSERNKAADSSNTTVPPRPTRLTFELPVTPSRSRSPSNQPKAYPRARPYRSLSEEGSRNRTTDTGKAGRRRRRHRRWSRLMGGSDTDEDSPSEQAEKARAKRHLEIGTYVILIKRPLPTMGYVKYIGPIEGEPGEWIGVELEHRVGNCDGSIKGQRFFKTDPQRGIFLKRFDVEAVI